MPTWLHVLCKTGRTRKHMFDSGAIKAERSSLYFQFMQIHQPNEQEVSFFIKLGV